MFLFVSLSLSLLFISPSLLICPLPLKPPHQNKNKSKKGTEEKKKKLNNQTKKQNNPSECGSCSVSQCFTWLVYPFSPNIFTYEYSSYWVTSLVPGLWLLLHYQYWILTGTPLGYPAVSLCHEDTTALDLMEQPCHSLWQFIDEVDVGGGQSKALDMALGGSWVGQSSNSPADTPPGQLFSMSPGKSPKYHSQ